MSNLLRTASLLAVLAALPAAAHADLIGVENDGTVVRIDERTASSSSIGESGIGPLLSLARDRSGTLYSLDIANNLYTIDPASGAATGVGVLTYAGPHAIISGLAFAPDGTLYGIGGVVEGRSTLLFRVDIEGEELLLVGDTGIVGIDDLAIAADGTFYSYSYSSSEDDRIGLGLVTIDPLTGRATDLSPDDNSPQTITPRALTFSAAGTLYGMDSPDGLFAFDTASGATRFIGLTGTDTVGGIAFVGPAAEPIPEPATLLLLGTGLAGFGLSLRRRRQAQTNADTSA